MRHQQTHYLEILRIEMKDLEEDLQLLIEDCARYPVDDYTASRVYHENKALYENELIGIREFASLIDRTDAESYPSLEDMIRDLKQQFNDIVLDRGLARAVTVCVDRKMLKVMRYVTQDAGITPRPLVNAKPV